MICCFVWGLVLDWFVLLAVVLMLGGCLIVLVGFVICMVISWCLVCRGLLFVLVIVVVLVLLFGVWLTVACLWIVVIVGLLD